MADVWAVWPDRRTGRAGAAVSVSVSVSVSDLDTSHHFHTMRGRPVYERAVSAGVGRHRAGHCLSWSGCLRSLCKCIQCAGAEAGGAGPARRSAQLTVAVSADTSCLDPGGGGGDNRTMSPKAP